MHYKHQFDCVWFLVQPLENIFPFSCTCHPITYFSTWLNNLAQNWSLPLIVLNILLITVFILLHSCSRYSFTTQGRTDLPSTHQYHHYHHEVSSLIKTISEKQKVQSCSSIRKHIVWRRIVVSKWRIPEAFSAFDSILSVAKFGNLCSILKNLVNGIHCSYLSM